MSKVAIYFEGLWRHLLFLTLFFLFIVLNSFLFSPVGYSAEISVTRPHCGVLINPFEPTLSASSIGSPQELPTWGRILTPSECAEHISMPSERVPYTVVPFEEQAYRGGPTDYTGLEDHPHLTLPQAGLGKNLPWTRHNYYYYSDTLEDDKVYFTLLSQIRIDLAPDFRSNVAELRCNTPYPEFAFERRGDIPTKAQMDAELLDCNGTIPGVWGGTRVTRNADHILWEFGVDSPMLAPRLYNKGATLQSILGINLDTDLVSQGSERGKRAYVDFKTKNVTSPTRKWSATTFSRALMKTYGIERSRIQNMNDFNANYMSFCDTEGDFSRWCPAPMNRDRKESVQFRGTEYLWNLGGRVATIWMDSREDTPPVPAFAVGSLQCLTDSTGANTGLLSGTVTWENCSQGANTLLVAPRVDGVCDFSGSVRTYPVQGQGGSQVISELQDNRQYCVRMQTGDPLCTTGSVIPQQPSVMCPLPPELVIIKRREGGPRSEQDFTLTLTGTAATPNANIRASTTSPYRTPLLQRSVATTYTVDEVNRADYIKTFEGDCQNVSLPANNTQGRSCTVVNRYVPIVLENTCIAGSDNDRRISWSTPAGPTWEVQVSLSQNFTTIAHRQSLSTAQDAGSGENRYSMQITGYTFVPSVAYYVRFVDTSTGQPVSEVYSSTFPRCQETTPLTLTTVSTCSNDTRTYTHLAFTEAKANNILTIRDTSNGQLYVYTGTLSTDTRQVAISGFELQTATTPTPLTLRRDIAYEARYVDGDNATRVGTVNFTPVYERCGGGGGPTPSSYANPICENSTTPAIDLTWGSCASDAEIVIVRDRNAPGCQDDDFCAGRNADGSCQPVTDEIRYDAGFTGSRRVNTGITNNQPYCVRVVSKSNPTNICGGNTHQVTPSCGGGGNPPPGGSSSLTPSALCTGGKPDISADLNNCANGSDLIVREGACGTGNIIFRVPGNQVTDRTYASLATLGGVFEESKNYCVEMDMARGGCSASVTTGTCTAPVVPDPEVCRACGCIELSSDPRWVGDYQYVTLTAQISNRLNSNVKDKVTLTMEDVIKSAFTNGGGNTQNVSEGAISIIAVEVDVANPKTKGYSALLSDARGGVRYAGGGLVHGTVRHKASTTSLLADIEIPADLLPPTTTPDNVQYVVIKMTARVRHSLDQDSLNKPFKQDTAFVDVRYAMSTEGVIDNNGVTETSRYSVPYQNTDSTLFWITRPFLMTYNGGDVLLTTPLRGLVNAARLYGMVGGNIRDIIGEVLVGGGMSTDQPFIPTPVTIADADLKQAARGVDTVLKSPGAVQQTYTLQKNTGVSLQQTMKTMATLDPKPDGTLLYEIPGNLVIAGIQDLVGERATLIVNGDLTLQGNITYGTPANTQEIPSLALIVKGKILLSPAVTRLDGVFVGSRMEPVPGWSTYYVTNTPKQLVINGGLFATLTDELIKSRPYVGPDMTKAPASIKFNYDGRIITHTPPALKELLKGAFERLKY